MSDENKTVSLRELQQGTTAGGLKCPRCACRDLPVVYVRDVAPGTRQRRRECRNCGHRLTTWEREAGR